MAARCARTGELTCWGYELSGETSPPSALRLTTLTGGDCGFDTSGAYVCWGTPRSPRFDEVVCWDRRLPRAQRQRRLRA
jgi:hypothetical protein